MLIRSRAHAAAAEVRDSWARYKTFFARASRWLGLAFALIVSLLLVLSLGGVSVQWPYTVGSLLLSVVAIAWSATAVPLAFVHAALLETPGIGPAVRRTETWLITIAFVAVFFTLLNVLVPLWQNPGALLIGTLTCLALVLGARVGLVTVRRETTARLFTGFLVRVLIFTWVSILATTFVPGIGRSVRTLGSSISRRIERQLLVLGGAGIPEPIDAVACGSARFVLRSTGDPVTLRDPITDEPAVWYTAVANGAFRLFDRKGRDPETYQELTLASTDRQIQAIVAWSDSIRARSDCSGERGGGDREGAASRDAAPTHAERAGAQSPVDSVGQPSPLKSSRSTSDVAEERVDLSALITDSLAKEHQDDWAPRPEWKALLSGRAVHLRFTQATLTTAVAVARRLTSMGARLTYSGVAGEGGRPSVEYSYADLPAAEAIESALASIARLQLNSTASLVPITITLK